MSLFLNQGVLALMWIVVILCVSWSAFIGVTRFRLKHFADAQRAAHLTATHDAWCTWNAFGELTAWSQQAENLYGWSASDVMGRSVSEVLKTRFPVSSDLAIETVKSTRRWEGTVWRLTCTGEEIPVDVRWCLVSKLGQADSILETGVEVRDRYRVQAAEDESKDLYRTLFEEAPIAMLREDWSGVKAMVEELLASGVEDLDAYLARHPEFFYEARKTHVFLDANHATLAMFGYSNKAEFLAVAPQLLPANPESNIHVVRALARGSGIAQGERLLQSVDGRKIPILWQTNVSPGRVDRLLFLAVNVEALKHAEEALMTAQAEWAHAARVAVLGELTASIAHEVNQPLGAIMLFADTALRWIDRPEPNLPRARNSISEISRSAGQAFDVIMKIRQFVRKSVPERVALDVREVLSDSAMLIELQAGRSGVSLKVDVEADLPSVAGDRVQVQQVVVNLTMNAVHALATHAGVERSVVIRAERSGDDQILFSVSDSGPGIQSEHLPQLFEPFFSTREGGLGLGLAICRSIVEAHGGTIYAENRQSGGAVFYFKLPLACAGS
jgi:PAS domain S-box-containing protein